MPKRKKRNPSLFDQDKHTLEFSPGQLVLAICTVLLMGLVCFLAGVVVGRYDDSYTSATLFMRDTTPQQEEEPVQVAEREDQEEDDSDDAQEMVGEGTQVSPRPFVEHPDEQDQPSMPDRVTPFVNAGEEVSAPSDDDEVSAPGEEPEEPPEADEEPEEEFAFEPLTPTDELTAEDVLDSAAEGGPYTIQVISYTAGDRALAEEFAQDMEEETGYAPTLSVSENGAYVRVLLGAFPDSETARAAMETLQELEKLEDGLVLRRPNTS